MGDTPSTCNASRDRRGTCPSERGRHKRDERGEEMRFMLAAIVAVTPLFASDNEPVKRLDAAANRISVVKSNPDQVISPEMPENAQCIVVGPELQNRAVIL